MEKILKTLSPKAIETELEKIDDSIESFTQELGLDIDKESDTNKKQFSN